jgi:MFS family permease
VVFLVVTGLLGSYSLTPLYSVYQEQWHFSDLMLSVAFACYSFGTVVALLLFGSLSDRRAVFVVACLGAITCGAGMALFAEFGTQLASQVGLNGASMGGLLVFVMFAAIGLVQVLLRRLGHLTSLVTGAIGTAVGWAGIVAALSAHQAAAMFAAAVVAGAGAGLAFMGATAGVNHVAAPERRAEAVSLYFLVLCVATRRPRVTRGL